EVVSQPAYLRAAASKPASLSATALSSRLVAASMPVSSSATALSTRLVAPPPMPSALAPARCSEATPVELSQGLRFYARHIKSLRKTSLMYSSPEQMERLRQVERNYETAVRLVYCRPPLSTARTPGNCCCRAAQSDLQSAAVEQSDTPQPDMTLDPKSASAQVSEGPADASSPAQVSEGPADASSPAQVSEGP
ncbi:hypothetical protein ILYODFUR_017188, partial [Ilyodon furcidens]